ncbi:uncharacterized protein TRAVEDRAFT_74999 [Trametes versicolor FP-101664 SS1]|uniref:uncharacterized protein n=1 Tax=Trametes versicolor (strain FP-101664) TaxID=717944 RepID=UPI0004622DE7|nr:uncharacterized protein TRAVEDRAFT_74999 [Trametes versicolor FP-101664 SS1]EIW52644.1 hypothetical protein TRAVEDRAFT_74999 [Trametes versicolor FP-101664 SS1]
MWNAVLPIHSLPAELLLHIFKQFVPALLLDEESSGWPDEEPQRPWGRLMRVCRHWCALIRNAAFFWRDVIIYKDTRWFDLALSRLGSAPICITLAPGCDLEGVLAMLETNTGRIGGLVFGEAIRDVDASRVESFLSLSFPALRSLEITMDLTVRRACAIGGCCSGLERLHLTQASLPWTPSVLANLKDLSLTDCCLSMPALPFLAFLDVLEYGQRLQHLYLSGFLSAVLDPQTSAPYERVVTLHGLKHLELSDVPTNVARLMTHLHTPAISHIELVGDCDRSVPSNAHASLLPQDLDTRFPVLQDITCVYFLVNGDENTLCFSHPAGTSFELRLFKSDVKCWGKPHWLEKGLSQLPALFGPALIELEVCGALNISPACWDRLFDSFPALQKLVMHEYNFHGIPLAMLRSLAAPAHSVPHGAVYTAIATGTGCAGRMPLRCPSLRHLRINGWDWSRRAFRQILECLRVRAAHGAERLECFGADAHDWDEETVTLAVVGKYRAQFLVVVDAFELDGWRY